MDGWDGGCWRPELAPEMALTARRLPPPPGHALSPHPIQGKICASGAQLTLCNSTATAAGGQKMAKAILPQKKARSGSLRDDMACRATAVAMMGA